MKTMFQVTLVLLFVLAFCQIAQADGATSVTDAQWGETRCDLVSPENRNPCVAAHARLDIAADQTTATRTASATPPPADASKVQEKSDTPAVARAKRVLEGGMKDPSSVQYKDVTYIQDIQAVCGLFNAKNGYGAYAGFVPFTVGQDGNAHIFDEGTSCHGSASESKYACMQRILADLKAIEANCSTASPKEE